MKIIIPIITILILVVGFIVSYFLSIKGISNLFTGIFNSIMLIISLFCCYMAVTSVMDNE